MILDQVADEDGLAAAKEIGREIGAEARYEDENRSRADARHREWEGDAQERGEGLGAEIGGRFEQARVLAFECGVERKDGEGQEPVDQAEDDGAIVVQQRQRLLDDAESL